MCSGATPPAGWTRSEVYFGTDPVTGTSYPGQYRVVTYSPAATASAPQDFVSGQPITVDGFQLTLRGAPATGDMYTVRPPAVGESMNQNVGNAQAMLALRDIDSFQGYTLSDGYIPVFAEVSTNIQTAKSAATFSNGVSQSAEAARANQSGVNLDALRKPPHSLLREVGLYSGDEVIQIGCRYAEVSTCGIGPTLVLRKPFLRITHICVDDSTVFGLAVLTEHVLDFMSEHKPEVVDAVEAQGHANDGFRVIQPEAGTVHF